MISADHVTYLVRIKTNWNITQQIVKIMTYYRTKNVKYLFWNLLLLLHLTTTTNYCYWSLSLSISNIIKCTDYSRDANETLLSETVTSLIFTALHALHALYALHATRSSHEKAARLSLCLSVKRVICDKKERNLCPYFPTTWRTIYPSFVTRRMVSGGRPLLPEILGQADPVGAKTLILGQYSHVVPQPIAKKFN